MFGGLSHVYLYQEVVGGTTRVKQTNKKNSTKQKKILNKTATNGTGGKSASVFLKKKEIKKRKKKSNYLVLNFVTLIEICHRVLLYRPMTN